MSFGDLHQETKISREMHSCIVVSLGKEGWEFAFLCVFFFKSLERKQSGHNDRNQDKGVIWEINRQAFNTIPNDFNFFLALFFLKWFLVFYPNYDFLPLIVVFNFYCKLSREGEPQPLERRDRNLINLLIKFICRPIPT